MRPSKPTKAGGFPHECLRGLEAGRQSCDTPPVTWLARSLPVNLGGPCGCHAEWITATDAASPENHWELGHSLRELHWPRETSSLPEATVRCGHFTCTDCVDVGGLPGAPGPLAPEPSSQALGLCLKKASEEPILLPSPPLPAGPGRGTARGLSHLGRVSTVLSFSATVRGSWFPRSESLPRPRRAGSPSACPPPPGPPQPHVDRVGGSAARSPQSCCALVLLWSRPVLWFPRYPGLDSRLRGDVANSLQVLRPGRAGFCCEKHKPTRLQKGETT